MARYIIYIIVLSLNVYSQAELTSLYVDYFKINENSERIKSSKISKETTVLITDGNQDTINSKFYDKSGYIIKEYSAFTISTGTVARKFKNISYFFYDENGRIKEKLDSANKDYKKTVITYEDNGTISDEEIYNSNEELIKEISHDYDNLSRLIETTEKDRIENCKTLKKYAYDSYSNMASYKLTSTCKDSNYKALNITFVYRYDTKNRIIEKNTYYSDKNFKTESFNYGTNGLLEKSYILVGQDIYTVFMYFYNESNYLTKIERTEINGDEKKIFVKAFVYDNFGNLLEVNEINEGGKLTSQIKYIYEHY